MNKWWNWVLAFSLLCLLLIAIPLSLPKEESAEELKSKFDDYIQNFNKTYQSPEEYDTRFQHFVTSLREIDKLNAASKGPDHLRAKYGFTKLSDMSRLEFKDVHLSDERQYQAPHMYGKTWNDNEPSMDAFRYDIVREHSDHHIHQYNDAHVLTRTKRAVLPLQVDWRTKGVIGMVRNQGMCGACWAFSTVGTMEAMYAIKTGTLQTLSVQEVIDCARLGNNGCAGGDICLLLDWLYMTQTPVEKDSEYPLRLTNSACKAKKNVTGVLVQTFTCNDFVGTENKILQALALHGPVVVAVNALTWQHYLMGVIQDACSGAPADLNHAVELVGYDLSADVPYYIVKNSWGEDFGIGGYLKLAIGSNMCGLANEVATVDVK